MTATWLPNEICPPLPVKFLLFALLLAAGAHGTGLDEIRATQQKLLGARDGGKPLRDEVPLEAVALVKRQLLSWLESRLAAFGHDSEIENLTLVLSGELHAALTPTQDDQDRLGEMEVSFSHPAGEPGWLQMSTDIGIPCGVDQSVYLYEWRNGRWDRRFAVEADASQWERYGPQNFVELQVSPPYSNGSRLVLTAGWPPACISLWQTLSIKLFRVDAAQTLLVDRAELANQGEDLFARLESSGALIEFGGSSIDNDRLSRRHILHYAVSQSGAQRIEPIALSAQAFVEEWLTRPWAEIAEWSEPQLAEWHAKLHKDYVSGEYQAVILCGPSGDKQVAINLDEEILYFSVTERGQYQFRMSGVSENPRSDCSGQDELLRLGDSKPTLFRKN
jgi:hypothetical protein